MLTVKKEIRGEVDDNETTFFVSAADDVVATVGLYDNNAHQYDHGTSAERVVDIEYLEQMVEALQYVIMTMKGKQ